MSLHYSPQIVTDNLIYYFDPVNQKGYPGIGNTFTDISIYKSPGSLSGVVFDPKEKGFVPGPLSSMPLITFQNNVPGPYLSAQLVNTPRSGLEFTFTTTKKFINNTPPDMEVVYDFFSSYGFSNFEFQGAVLYLLTYPTINKLSIDFEGSSSYWWTGPDLLPLSSLDFNKINNKITTWTFVFSETASAGKIYVFNDSFTTELNLVKDFNAFPTQNITWSGPPPFRNILFLNKNYFYNKVGSDTPVTLSDLETGYTQLSVDVTTYNVMMYNRALTNTEVLQNYKALRSRYT